MLQKLKLVQTQTSSISEETGFVHIVNIIEQGQLTAISSVNTIV